MNNKVAKRNENRIELIKINEENQTVSARELHYVLGIRKHFTQWFDDQKRWFNEGVDYEAFTVKVNAGVGTSAKTDYVLTLDCAKHIAMMSKVKAGKEVRQYFIEAEKQLQQVKEVIQEAFQIPADFASALRLAANQAEQLEQQQKQLELAAPKVAICDRVMSSNGNYDLGTVAKMFGIGKNKFFYMLRDIGVLINDGAQKNTPFQRHMKYFKVITTTKNNQVYSKTLLNPSGLEWFERMLQKQPDLIEHYK